LVRPFCRRLIWSTVFLILFEFLNLWRGFWKKLK
jgi:hypothetical protein